jgi:hypothetical protein
MLKELVAKAMTPVTILLEAYRIFNGTLLVIFVPGVCGGKACLPQQNFENGSTLYKVNCGVNLLAFAVFIALYAIEIQREYKLSAYLRMNPEKPSDSITVKAAFESLTTERKNTIHSFDKLYQRAVISTIFIFAVNTLLSGYVIGTEYANDKGPILFATGTVLIASKIYNIISIGFSEGYASAYLHTRSQFNDAKPTKTSAPELTPI